MRPERSFERIGWLVKLVNGWMESAVIGAKGEARVAVGRVELV